MVGSVLSGKDGILSPGESWVPGQEGCLLTEKVEKWVFSGQRSVVDSSLAWKEAGASESGLLQCLAVSVHFIG